MTTSLIALDATVDHVRADNRYCAMQFAHLRECLLLNEMYNTDAVMLRVYAIVEVFILRISIYSNRHLVM